MKLQFAARFVGAFFLLLLLWALSNFSVGYRAAVFRALKVASPVMTGWWLEKDEGSKTGVAFEKGEIRMSLEIDPALLSMAHVPLLALIWATPGLGVRGVLVRSLVGMAAFFLIHVAVLAVYPVVLARPNWFTDTVGVFSGLLSFVLAPQLIWFVLTYPRLAELWRLGKPPEARAPAVTSKKPR
ncbi:MAG: hypothetical protein KatS3mg077_1922 [Candidatus Binatia bacterium]|nr:MAG: hypothetical protein KatS3mg077_1922 [Candidatus Binatia bacterium]